MEKRHLVKHPKCRDTWSQSYGNGMPKSVKGTNTIFFINKVDAPSNRQKDNKIFNVATSLLTDHINM